MEKVNSILKNRYFLVIKDDKPYAYFSVKKDFYTEGYLVDDKTVLVGYFSRYKSFDVHIIDSNDNLSRKYLNGLSILPKNDNEDFSIDGEVLATDYCLYRSSLDEYCDRQFKEEIACDIQIKKIDDLEVIHDINYLIRSSTRKLIGANKEYYEMLKKHRYGNLKESLSGLKSLSRSGKDLGIPDSVIKDLELFLKNLNLNSSRENIDYGKNRKKKQKVKKRKNTKR